MHLHAGQSAAALEAGLHVLSEVTAAVDLEQCRRLVRAAQRSSGLYMMAENCNYTVPNLVVLPPSSTRASSARPTSPTASTSTR